MSEPDLDASARVVDGCGRVTLMVGDDEYELSLNGAEDLSKMLDAAWNEAAMREDDARTQIASEIAEDGWPTIKAFGEAFVAGNIPELLPRKLGALAQPWGLFAGLGLVYWTGVTWKPQVSKETARDLHSRAIAIRSG